MNRIEVYYQTLNKICFYAMSLLGLYAGEERSINKVGANHSRLDVLTTIDLRNIN